MFIRLHFHGSGEEFYLNTKEILYFSDAGEQTLVVLKLTGMRIGVRETAATIAKMIKEVQNIR